jgi:hypothetical protein
MGSIIGAIIIDSGSILRSIVLIIGIADTRPPSVITHENDDLFEVMGQLI